MSTGQIGKEEVHVLVRNIGGISNTEVTLTPGVTILAGRNATNRTSLLQAIMLGLGSEKASLKGDAETGEVELEFGETKYTRTLSRNNGTIALDGEPYLEDPETADLFAFLLEQNEARTAVQRGGDLRELIMRPIDTEAIQNEIERLKTERREIDQQLEEIEDKESRLTDLKQQRTQLETEIDEKRSELEIAETELESLDSTVEESREEKHVLESKLDTLHETRSELERVRQDIETESKSIEALNEEQEEIETELSNIGEEQQTDASDYESELDRLRERRQTINSMVGELQNIIQFNEDMLDEDRTDIRSALEQDTTVDGAITDQLVESKTTCWTCGSDVEKTQIESTLEQLREYRKEKLKVVSDIDDQLEDLKEQQRIVVENRQQRERLENRLDQINDEIEKRKRRVESLRNERTELEDQLDNVEAEVDKLENDEFNEILNKHREANEIEFELNQLHEDLETIESEIESIQEKIDERGELQAERESVTEELTEYRTKIDQIEDQAVEQFNTHMETVLELLEYDNLDRIWIERVKRDVREGRQKVERTQFELHIVRQNDEGVAYEDTVDHLSESEREVTGLVFALAGYLVHEVYETLPFIILDSLEAIDSDRIASLVEHFSDYAEYSVVALLPEDEAALDGNHQRVTDV